MMMMGDNCTEMEGERKPLRADAERNRQRLIESATSIFCSRGLECGVGEIAKQAGVGRGTLFRNFPSKEHLIAAVVVERMRDSTARGRALLEAEDPGEALWELIDQAAGRSQTDRALFEALDDTWLANEEISAAHAELLDVLDRLMQRAQNAGVVRPDVSAVDLMMMVKGVCEAARSYQHIDPDMTARQLDLVWAALTTPGSQRPLRGTARSVEALRHAPATGPAAAVPESPGRAA
jgi:AcrR family transcriptional regulator